MAMAKIYGHFTLLLLAFLLISIDLSKQLQSSESQNLLQIQSLLNFPEVLSSWNNNTDFCNEQSSYVTVICYENTITQLHIIGNKSTKFPPLPRSFSTDSFFTVLSRLHSLKVLTLVSLGLRGTLPSKISRLSSLEILNISSNFFHGVVPKEISSLRSLQTLVLDDNIFSGRIPEGLGTLSLLAVMSMKKNLLTGYLPDSLARLTNLRILVLSHNHFLGRVPDISGLTNLQVLELEDNSLGPQFPKVGDKIVTLVLRKNKFTSALPDALQSYYHLQRLDVAFNRFVGPFPTFLLSLPSLSYLNIQGNRFTGMLFEDLPCNEQLQFVDLSTNLLTGRLPSCLLSESSRRDVLYAENCLTTEPVDRDQHPVSFCRNEALAVGILPHRKKPKKASRAVIASAISGGIIGGFLLVALGFLVVKRVHSKNMVKSPPTRLISENASTGYTSKWLTNARYVSQAMKLGALGVPAYRAFSLEELEMATNSFDTSTFMGEGSHGQMYKGQLKDGSHVAIRCLKMKRSHGTQSFMHHIEMISKLRHQHLVSCIGHCFEYYLDDSSVSRVFLIFEYVPNGTLRDWISGRHGTRGTSIWSQRIAAAIGVAKGIQFLHTGIVPGVFSNNLKITDILLDHNLVAKISSYNLPLLAENMGKVGNQTSGLKEAGKTRVKHQEKSDILDFGVILLEIIVGRPLNTWREVETVKTQLQESITADDAASIKRLADPAICNASSDQAMKTLSEICSRCLLKHPADRPSIEDVLWNLQFAGQVQDAWQSNDGSPLSFSSQPAVRLDASVQQ